MKIFFVGAHPQIGTGYARMTNKITNYLANIPDIEVICYAFDYVKGSEIKDRYVDSRIKIYDATQLSSGRDSLGIDYIGSILSIEKPDVLFIYNNPVMAKKIMEAIPLQYIPPTKYLYLDILYPWQSVSLYDFIKKCNFDHIFVFLEYWKNHLINDFGFSETSISVLPQTIDFDMIKYVSPEEAKKQIGIKPTDYLIVNMNRNAWRKGWNITISAFLEFLKRCDMDSSIKLMCGCDIYNSYGYDIKLLIEIECTRLNIDINKVMREHIITHKNSMTGDDSYIYKVYNAGDIGLNTCTGEGFGLTTLEHLAHGKPQIVSGVPALKETIGEYTTVIEPDLILSYPPYEAYIGGQVAYIDYKKVAEQIEFHYKNRSVIPDVSDKLKLKYSPENAYKVLDRFFTNGTVPASK
jgi:glycosyltransferase involved in cell wall biosynthesis